MTLSNAKAAFAQAVANDKPRMYSNMFTFEFERPTVNAYDVVFSTWVDALEWIEARQNKENPQRYDVMVCYQIPGTAMKDDEYFEKLLTASNLDYVIYSRDQALDMIAQMEKRWKEAGYARCEDQPFASRIESPMTPKAGSKPSEEKPKMTNVGGGLMLL